MEEIFKQLSPMHKTQLRWFTQRLLMDFSISSDMDKESNAYKEMIQWQQAIINLNAKIRELEV